MNPIILLHLSYKKIIGQTGFFDLVMATSLGEEKSVLLCLKIDLVSQGFGRYMH